MDLILTLFADVIAFIFQIYLGCVEFLLDLVGCKEKVWLRRTVLFISVAVFFLLILWFIGLL